MQEAPLTPSAPPVEWLFLDLNSFFASCEQQDRPALRGRPVAVVPVDADSTCAIAASVEAKRFGIKTGTRIYDALRRCPQLICVQARHNLYVDYHHKVISETVRHTPINKIWSIDELSSRLPPGKRNVQAAMLVAARIKEGLRKNVGDLITASIGIAPNGFLAKVATDMQKPDGLVVLPRDELPDRLFDLRLTDLPGINVNMEMRLWQAGIKSVEDFWNLTPRHARHVWGSVDGERFWYNLHGVHMPDRATRRSMVGHSRILDTNLRDAGNAYAMARRLTIKAAARLRRLGFYASAFDMSVRPLDAPRWAASVTIPPSQDNFTFLQAAHELWQAMQAETNARRFKKLSVTLHGLLQEGDITPDLFDAASPAHQKECARRAALSDALDALNKKMGAETVRIGITPRTQTGYVGTKIAFSRIPDKAEFHE